MSAPFEPRKPHAWPDSPAGADIWHVGLDAAVGLPLAAADLLDPNERRRAGTFRDALASRRYIVSHIAARTVLGGYLGMRAQVLTWSTGEHGKPGLTGPEDRWQWSLSRSGGHALIAVCLTAPVGVDIEQVGTDTKALSLAPRFLPPEEAADVAARNERTGLDGMDGARAAYHRYLSRKESCVKASGGRLLDGLNLRVPEPGTVLGIGKFAGEQWTLCDLPAPPGFVATLATLTAPGRGQPESAAALGDRLRFFEWAWPPPDLHNPEDPYVPGDVALKERSR